MAIYKEIKVTTDVIATAAITTTEIANNSVINADIVDGTININTKTTAVLDSTRLPTIPTRLGGTGLTTFGTANQVLRVNSGATKLEFGTISVPVTSVDSLTGAVTLATLYASIQPYGFGQQTGTNTAFELAQRKSNATNCGNINCQRQDFSGYEIVDATAGKFAARRVYVQANSWNCNCVCNC